MKHPDLLRGAMATTLLAVEEFHVNHIGLSLDDAQANMAYTQERIINPTSDMLDNPHNKNEARHRAIWFVRTTAKHFKTYFFGESPTEVTHKASGGLSSPNLTP